MTTYNPTDLDCLAPTANQLDPALRTLPYAEYLQTTYWRHQVQPEALRRAEYHCQICFAEGQMEIHHRSYRHRGCGVEKELRDLVCLCADCHSLFHEHGRLKTEGA